MLLLKKFNLVAIALVAFSPIIVSAADVEEGLRDGALRTERTPAPVRAADPQDNLRDPVVQAPPVVQPAPVPAPPYVRGVNKSIDISEHKNFFKRLKITKVTTEDGTRLKFSAFIPKACAEHVRIELDRPSAEEGSTTWDLRIEKADLVDTKDPKKVIRKADDECKEELAGACTRDEESGCVKIQAVAGVKGVEDTILDADGNIKLKIEKWGAPDTDPEAIARKDIPGGPMHFDTPATLKAAELKKDKEDRHELLKATCAEAEKGGREDIESLKEQLGSKGLSENKDLIERLEAKADEVDFAALQKEVGASKSLAELNELIDKAEEFAKAHDKMTKQVVKLLVDKDAGIAGRAMALENANDEGDSNTFFNAKLKLAERALKVARGLDPTNSNLKKALAIAKLERFKFAAATGSDRFYNDNTRREAYNSMMSVGNWAQSSKDPEAHAIARDYAKTLANRPFPVANPYGGPMGYAQGTALDQTFVTKSIEEEFRQYKQNTMTGGIGSNYQMNSGGSTF